MGDTVNPGKKTVGVDGIKNLLPIQRFNLIDLFASGHLKVSPTLESLIPKPGKDKKCPLGILFDLREGVTSTSETR